MDRETAILQKDLKLLTVQSFSWKVHRTLTPAPHFHRTRWYLCSFMIIWTPLSRVLVTIGNYKKHPLFRAFLGNLPQDSGQEIPPSDWTNSTLTGTWPRPSRETAIFTWLNDKSLAEKKLNKELWFLTHSCCFQLFCLRFCSGFACLN